MRATPYARGTPQPRLIESCYPPERLQTATPGRRLAGALIDALVIAATLYVGWLVWFAIAAQRGQTPGKQMLGMYVMAEDGSRASCGHGWVRELVVKTLLFVSLGTITLGVAFLAAALWCLWDRERQCMWDKITSTYVAYSPSGYRPATAADLRRLGQQPPAAGGQLLAATEPPAAPPAPAAAPPWPPAPPAPPEAMPPAQPTAAPPAPPEAAAPPAGGSSAADRLRELQRLRDDGLITAEQFEQRRARIVEEL